MNLNYEKIMKLPLTELNIVYETLKRIRDRGETELLPFHWRHTIKPDVLWLENLLQEKVMTKYYENE